MKYHIISISHIMKSYETIMKSYIVCNITHIVYKIEDFDCYAYTPMGGNLCKYAYYIAIKLIKYMSSRSINMCIYTKYCYAYPQI